MADTFGHAVFAGVLLCLVWVGFARAQDRAEALSERAGTIRIATFAGPLSRDGPGLLLRDLMAGDDPQISAITDIFDHIAPDIVLLTKFDYDAGSAALKAFSDQLAAPYPYAFALPTNAGLQTGLDLDGDGYAGDARDAMGFGRFLGQGGMALLSRYPIKADEVTDHTGLLWRDLPDAVMPLKAGRPFLSDEAQAILRLSSTGHWIVPIDLGGGQTVTLLAYSATPPVFDGPENFNGLRNRDELRLWEKVLDGVVGLPPLRPVVIGNANLDPADGGGSRGAMADFLARPDLQDPLPESAGGRASANSDHQGDPALDTANWPDGRPGNLRVSYVLPSVDLVVLDAGVFWPAPQDPEAALLGADGLAAGPHRLVWVDIALPTEP